MKIQESEEESSKW